MHLSRWFFVLILALSFALLPGCQRSGEDDIARTDDGVMRLGRVEVVDTVARAVAPSNRPLVLEGLRGSVHVTGANQTTADLSFVRRGRGDSQEAGQSVLEGIAITESGTESEYTYTLEADEENYAAVDIRGRVPGQTTLRVDRLSGPVRIDSVGGALTIEHDHGDVTVRGAAAPVEVMIKNGDIHVDFRTLPAEGDMLLETSNGDLHLGVPAGAVAQIDAQTNVGTIRTQGLSFSAERFAPINAGARYNAQLGEGGPTLELRTQNGSITLRAVAPASADTTTVSESATVPSGDTVMAPRPDTVPAADTVEGDTTEPDAPVPDTTAADTVS